MKTITLLLGLVVLGGGCAWLHHGNGDAAGSGNESIAGPDYGLGRGTTGVSSGADVGRGITGSDAAPPR